MRTRYIILLCLVYAIAILLFAPRAWSATSTKVVGTLAQVSPTAKVEGAATVSLLAAQNETESFQVVLTAEGTALEGMRATASPLVSDSATLPTNSVLLYREEYLNLTKKSDGEGTTGLFPDALIPDVDITGTKRNAFPFSVPKFENRVVWVDINVPDGQPEGTYTGTISFSGTNYASKVNVSITVVNVSLPATSSLRGAFDLNFNEICKAHVCSGDQGWNLWSLYAKTALNNRVTIAKPYGEPPSVSFTKYAAPLYSGTASTVRPGARLADTIVYQYSASKVGAWKTEAAAGGYVDRISFHCDEIGTNVTLWTSCKNAYGVASTQWNNTAPSVGPLKLDVTITDKQRQWALDYTVNGTKPFESLAKSITTLVPVVNRLHDKVGTYQGSQSAAYDVFKSGGGKLWTYTSCLSMGCSDAEDTNAYWTGWPSYGIDQPASEQRATPWIVFNNGASGEYYFETVKKLQTAWTNQYNEGGNGDGTLFYPGTSARLGTGPDVPVESIRLKRIRDGREDYELMVLAGKETALPTTQALFPTPYQTAVTQAQLDFARVQLFAAVM